MDHTPVRVRVALLLPLAGAMVFAGTARVAPTIPTDWALAGMILAAALVQAEITRRQRAGSHEPEPHAATAMASVWALAAAIGVHLTLAIALVLVLCAYHCLRGKHGGGDLFYTFAASAGSTVCAVIAAHFVASFGAWATPSPEADATGILTVAAAGAVYLVVNQVASFVRHRRVFLGRVADLGLHAALLATGAVVGALAPGEPLIVVVAIPVVVMLHSAALTQQLEDDAFIDQKTGLATAACWQANADRVFAEAAPETRPIGVLMVDLDLFKRLNDTYGHRAGDDVLAAVGECLRTQLRHSDLAGRFGGEEFTVLLPDADVIDTMAAAERIRTAISALSVTTVDKHSRHTVITGVTASIGAASHPHHGATAHDCLRVADNYVYQAKQQGRNTVVGIGTENLASLRSAGSRQRER